MRYDENIEHVHQHHENREEQREPADFGENGRTLLHDKRMYEVRIADSVNASRMEELPKTLSSELTFEGLVFRVHIDSVRFPDRSVHRFDVLEHRGSVGVAATLADERVLLVRQYRQPFRSMLWEIPAGRTEPNEDPGTAAARELREETGYRCARLHPLGTFAVSPGYCTERMHLFHADALTPGEQSLDADERITVFAFTLDEAEKLMLAGEIVDMKTALALSWLRGPRHQLAPTSVDT